MNSSNEYIEIQVTTNYSFLRGASHIEELERRREELGAELNVAEVTVAPGCPNCAVFVRLKTSARNWS